MKPTNIDRYKLGQRIYKYRKEIGESQTDIANLLGVKRQLVSRIELGLSNLPYDKAIILASHFKISVSELIDGETLDDLYTMELPVYVQKNSHIGLGAPSTVRKFNIEPVTYKGNDGSLINKTYRIDERIRGVSSSDLYVIEIDNEKNAFNVPVGSKVIVQKLKDKDDLDLSKPTFLVLSTTITLTTNGGEYDVWLEKHPVVMEYVTKVIPMDSREKGKEQLYRYGFPNGTEWLSNEKQIKKMCVGIVKKIILDY